MRKFFAMLAILGMTSALLAGCVGTDTETPAEEPPAEEVVEPEVPAEEPAAEEAPVEEEPAEEPKEEKEE